ncbi:MAG: PEP-CTERM sorting domain-containing protein [Symploca sp. SIO2C1]|nr:PEP-CTERM sorting domain-containing protein [Symploca sp. SIO2C1]
MFNKISVTRTIASCGTAFIMSTGMGITATSVQASTFGFADIVLDFFNSGANPAFPNPNDSYGGDGIDFPVPVNTDVVLGDAPTNFADSLSLPTDSFVIVGFLDEVIIDRAGNDLAVREIGGGGERAQVFISSLLSNDMSDFIFLGIAQDDLTTSFDLGSIGFTDPVKSVKIVGLDNFGGSPGFDLVNVQGLPGSLKSVPEPTITLGIGLSMGLMGYLKKKQSTRLRQAKN